MRPRPPASAYAAAVGMTFAFGLSFVATKYALRGFEPLLVALLRFALAGAILWVLLAPAPGARTPSRGATSAAWRCWASSRSPSTSASRTSASPTRAPREAAILIATIPIFVAMLNVFTLRERDGGAPVGRHRAFVRRHRGARAASAGRARGGSAAAATCSSSPPRSRPPSTASWRGACSLTRSALFVTTFQNLFGALFMLPLALVEAALVGVRRPTADAVGGVLFLTVVCSVTRLPAAQLRVPLHRGQQAERVHQPHAGGRRWRSPSCVLGERFTAGAGGGSGRRRRRGVAHEHRRPGGR